MDVRGLRAESLGKKVLSGVRVPKEVKKCTASTINVSC